MNRFILDRTCSFALFSLVALIQLSIDCRATAQSLDGFNPNANGVVYSAVVQPDNKIQLAGDFTTVGASTRNRAVRLSSSGTVEGGFNPNADSSVFNTIVLADGKLLAGGDFANIGGASCARLARLNSNGTLDAAFPGNSVANGYLLGFATQLNGKTVFTGGFSSVNGQSQRYLGRLNADGTVDAAFPGAGSSGNFVRAVATQPDQKVIIGGTALVRRMADGTPDPGFSVTINGTVHVALVQPDGKILIGGEFTLVNGVAKSRLARLNPDGSLDSAFTSDLATGVAATSLALQTDGMVIVAGTFTNAAGTTRNNIARLNTDGSLDGGFNPNANGTVNGVTLQSDGSVLLAGGFTSVSGSTRNRIARFSNHPATQSLTVPDAGRILWMRGGSSPETHHVTFDLSTNGGVNWTALGTGTRVDGGWELSSLLLPASGMIRGRAQYPCGYLNGSSSLVETTATFNNPNPVPEITVEQPAGTTLVDGNSTVTFGSVPHGSEASVDFTIRNLGGASLDSIAASIDGPAAGDYTLTTSPPSSLPAAGTSTFTVRFRPSSSGTRAVSLHIASNDQDENPFHVNLAGTGLAPEIVVEQPAGTNLADGTATATFKNTVAGTASSLTFTIRNQGNADLTGLNPTIEGADAADFAVTALPVIPVTPAGSTTFVVRFAPATAGAKHAVMRLANNDPDESLFDINLAGQGLVPDADDDGDSLTNIQEYWLATNPDVPDSDSDGTTDGVEYNKGMNPLGADSDGDGISDAYEVVNGLNPIRNDAGEDTDFDFITNLQEFTNGTKSNTAMTGTDGVSDYRRINGKGTWRAYYDRNNRLLGQLFDNGTNVIQGYDRNSNPVRQILRHKADNDGDGLLDIWEVANGLDPNNATGSNGSGDADHDGVSNLQEQAANTDPQSASSKTTSDGIVIATATAFPWIPASYVMGTGQLDGTGIEEIVISGDGNPGTTDNVIKIFTPNTTGAIWTEETVPVGPVGVTSICVGHGNAANTIFIGTRAVAPAFGQIIKFVKTGGVWTPTVVLASTDHLAWVAGYTDWNAGKLKCQYSSASNIQRLMYVNTAGTFSENALSSYNEPNLSGPKYARDQANGVIVSRMITRSGGRRMELYAYSSVRTTAWSSSPVLADTAWQDTPFHYPGLVRPSEGPTPSLIQFRQIDLNTSGGADDSDVTSLVEIGTNQQTRSNFVSGLFAPMSQTAAIGTVFPIAGSSGNILITADGDGVVRIWDGPPPLNIAPLRRHLLTDFYRGKTWHEFRSLRGIEAGDSAVGLHIDPAAPAAPKLALWRAADLAAIAASTPLQTAPAARIASAPAAGGPLSTVDVDLWDGEGNASRVVLQYRLDPAAAWSEAIVLSLDGGSATAFVEAKPAGSRHRLIWDAAANLGSFSGNVLLRARATDAAEAGAWSEAMPYTVNIASSLDDDGDGFPNSVEAAFGTDPASASSRPVLTATPQTDGSVRLDWPTAANRTYRVETSTDLTDWTPYRAGLATSNLTIPLAQLTDPKRFYRIAAE